MTTAMPNDQGSPPTLETRAESSSGDVSRLAAGAGFSLMGAAFGRGIGLVSQIIFARLLGPAGFGLYILGWTILRILSVIAQLGLVNGVIHFGSRFRLSDPPRFRGALLGSLGFAALGGAVLGIFLGLTSRQLSLTVFQEPELTSVLRWFAAALPASAFLAVAAAATRISKDVRYSVMAEGIVQPGSQLVIFCVLYLLGLRLFGAVIAGAISFGVASLLALYYLRRLYPEPFSGTTTFVTSELLAFSLPTLAAGILNLINLRVDRLMIGYFLPASEVGIYQAAAQISLLFTIVLASFNSIFSPMIADLYHKEARERLDTLFKVSTKWGVYLSLPLLVAILASPAEILSLFFGGAYSEGRYALVLLSLGQMVNVGTGAVAIILIMTGHQKRWLLVSAPPVLVNIVLNVILIPRLGVLGAALSTAVVISALFLSALIMVRQTIHIWPYDRRYLKGMSAAAVALVSLLALRSLHLESATVVALLSLTAASGVFGLVLLVLGFDQEDRRVIRLIRNRITR